MSPALDLKPVRAKFERAQRHWRETHAALERLSEVAPVYLETRVDGDQVVGLARIATPLDAAPLAPIVGDLISNLRESLDYLVWQLVLRNNARPSKRSNWPCALTENRWNSAIANDLGEVSSDDLAEIRRWQPFVDTRGEPHLLHVLDYLANFTRHRLLPITLAPPKNIEVAVTNAAGNSDVYAAAAAWDPLVDGLDVIQLPYVNAQGNSLTVPPVIHPRVKVMADDFPFSAPPGWRYDLDDLVDLIRRIIDAFDPATVESKDSHHGASA